MVAWLLKFNIWSYIFLNFDFFSKCVYKYISHVQHTIFTSAGCPFHTPRRGPVIFQVYIIILFFYDYKGQ